jgi:proton-dependent oligopeptide transporter, POT family
LLILSTVKVVPHENILPKAFRALTLAARNGFKLDNAKATHQMEKNGHVVPWDDGFIDELKRGLIAARIMCVRLSSVWFSSRPKG